MAVLCYVMEEVCSQGSVLEVVDIRTVGPYRAQADSWGQIWPINSQYFVSGKTDVFCNSCPQPKPVETRVNGNAAGRNVGRCGVTISKGQQPLMQQLTPGSRLDLHASL